MNRLLVAALSLTVLCTGTACESGSGSNPENSAGSITSVSTTTAAVQLDAGTSTTVPIIVERTTGFVGSVELTLDGTPNGVTYSFAPPVLTFGQSTSTLTLVSILAVLPGSYPLVIRASSKSVDAKTTQVVMTVPAPNVNVVVGSGSATVRLEDTVTLQVTVTRSGGGFVDPIALAITNLPSGMTGTFTPAVLSGAATASVLTLSPALGTTLGASTLQLTTSSLSLPLKNTPLPLTVLDALAPIFRIRTSFPAVQVPNGGGTVQQTLNIPRGGGLIAPVVLSAAGLPVGVVAKFTPTSVIGTSSVLELTSTPGTEVGNFAVVVRGVATGASDQEVPITFTVSGVKIFSSAVTVQRGRTANFTMGVQNFGSFVTPVTVALAGATAGFSFTGLPFTTSGTPIPQGFGRAITVDESVVPGVYTFGVQAISQSQVVAVSTIVVTVIE